MVSSFVHVKHNGEIEIKNKHYIKDILYFKA
jgi:hypothetical protein